MQKHRQKYAQKLEVIQSIKVFFLFFLNFNYVNMKLSFQYAHAFLAMPTFLFNMIIFPVKYA